MKKFQVPDDVTFQDLKLVRTDAGDFKSNIEFDTKVLVRVLEANGIYQELEESQLSEFVIIWYRHVLETGGQRDKAADEIFALAALADLHEKQQLNGDDLT